MNFILNHKLSNFKTIGAQKDKKINKQVMELNKELDII